MRKIFIDCTQNIPCDPCRHSCPVGAITFAGDITDNPEFDRDKCIGCGKCVAACPGQACYLVDEDFTEDLATVDFPYEFLPYPEVGMKVTARNNQGEDVCEATVENVNTAASNHQTAVVRISVPKEFAYKVRGMKRLPR